MILLMSIERQVQRYAAYFKGWCQAFGEHEPLVSEGDAFQWLVGDNQLGVILPDDLTRPLYRAVLSAQNNAPSLFIGTSHVEVGEVRHDFTTAPDAAGLAALRQLAQSAASLHLFLTYHFMYPSGTRILTFSRHQPLSIIYKQIGPMRIVLT